MFNWLKNLFAIEPGKGMVPISSADVERARTAKEQSDDIDQELKAELEDIKEMTREWIYIGDGMMEEVIRPKANPGDNAKPLDATSLKSRLNERKAQGIDRSSASRSSGYTNPTSTPYYGDSYDSGGSYSSCDSSSPSSCD